jgi:hypothetical protein
MENYTLQNGEIWCEIPNVPISFEERQILINGNEQEKKELIDLINKKNELIPVKGKKLKKCKEIFDKYKPKLKETDVYKHISFDFATDGNIILGSYNYILNKMPNHILIN